MYVSTIVNHQSHSFISNITIKILLYKVLFTKINDHIYIFFIVVVLQVEVHSQLVVS